MPPILFVWDARPVERFMQAAVTLTAISLVPPLLEGANTATTTALLGYTSSLQR